MRLLLSPCRRTGERTLATVSQPAMLRIGLLPLMRVLDPPGLGNMHPPSPRRTHPARSPSHSPGAHPRASPRRRPRNRAPRCSPCPRRSIHPASASSARPARVAPMPPAAPPTAPSARPQLTLLAPHATTRDPLPLTRRALTSPISWPMEDLLQPRCGATRPPSPRRALFPTALCASPCMAPWQPGSSNHRLCRTSEPVAPRMPLSHAMTVLEPAPFELLGSTCHACALHPCGARQSACGCK